LNLSKPFRINEFAGVSEPQNTLCLAWGAIKTPLSNAAVTSDPSFTFELANAMWPKTLFQPGAVLIANRCECAVSAMSLEAGMSCISPFRNRAFPVNGQSCSHR
jgi:hypothetical protein